MSKMCKEFLLHRIAKLDNGNKFDKNKMTHTILHLKNRQNPISASDAFNGITG